MSSRPSLFETHPELCASWDYERNTDMTPHDVTYGSGKKVWWVHTTQGGVEHSWRSTVSNRVNGKNCPVCSGKKVLCGYNDLNTTHPHIATEWDYVKNQDVTPEMVTHGSERVSHWVCPVGHEYSMPIYRRLTGAKSGCPYCANKSVLVGYNDFATTHPEILKHWDAEKNHPVTTEMFTHGTGVKYWWRCDQNHSWSVAPRSIINGTWCPMCSGRSPIKGENDLETVYPEIAKMWHPTRNGTLRPSDVTSRSSRKMWWLCSNNHEWESVIASMSHNVGCPICGHKTLLKGYNDFATTHPELLKEWDWDANTLAPEDIFAGGPYRASWKCGRGHTWEAPMYSRTGAEHGCPKCANKVSDVETDILEFIKSTGVGTIRNDRKTITPYELDILLPGKSIAVELNGIYWHTEAAGKDKWYHLNKTKSCEDRGIRLIHIWEDDWRDRQPIVERMLKSKLGISDEKSVYARNTTVEVIDHVTSQKFLEENHIQGGTKGSVRLGLRGENNGPIFAVMVLKCRSKSEGEWELQRYATACHVVGGHSKLLSAFKNRVPEWKKLVTFADLAISDGSLYTRTGWVLDKVLDPDYMYVVGSRRVHKFNYRRKRFRDDPQLTYDESMSESELALMNGIQRIWDCGKNRYIMENSEKVA